MRLFPEWKTYSFNIYESDGEKIYAIEVNMIHLNEKDLLARINEWYWECFGIIKYK